MAAFEELKAQRDFLLENRWIGGNPGSPNEGCLAYQGSSSVEGRALGSQAGDIMAEIIDVPGWYDIIYWNDNECSGSGEAIAVLEEAMRVAKERGLTDEA